MHFLIACVFVLVLVLMLSGGDTWWQLGVGEFFGELALLEPDSRSSTVHHYVLRHLFIIIIIIIITTTSTTTTTTIISDTFACISLPHHMSQVTALCDAELLILRRQDFAEIIRDDAEVCCCCCCC
jgi:CRP-like cAMP-binding protein